MAIGLLLIGGVAALVGGIVVLSARAEARRVESLRAAAAAMGFQFAESVEPSALGAFPLFERGHSRKARGALSGVTAGRPVTICDYQYTISSGKNSQRHRQTIAVFADAGAGQPDFELGPQNFLHRIGKVFGYQDIDFDGDEEFSSAFLLRGGDEAAIRRCFTPSVRAAFRNHPGWSAQLRDGRLLVFRADRRCQAEEIPVFLAEALRLAAALPPSA